MSNKKELYLGFMGICYIIYNIELTIKFGVPNRCLA